MKSPFPGMDPYLETYWGDVHHGLIGYARDQLRPNLPRDLRARMNQRVFVESEGGLHRPISPDVYVVEHPRAEGRTVAAESSVAVAEPLVLRLPDEPIAQGFLEIIEVGSGSRVVTVIEFLSPSNKVAGKGQELYLEKQREVLASHASLVEIDLTRAGRRVLAVRPEWIPLSHRTTYQVCVRRGWKMLEAEIYRVPLQERLPIIRIPLRQTDRDVPLDLQALVDLCYYNGDYDDLNYGDPLDPPLGPEDAAWADQLLRSQGKR